MLDHAELLRLHDTAYNNNYDTRLKAADDMLFAWVTQWDDTYLSESDLGYRGEFNIIRKAMRQIITDLISNPISVDFDPVDDTNESAADIMDGMYRADMRNNTSQEAKKNANQEAVVCGVAAWELRNEWKTNRLGDERQVIKRYPLYEANNNVMWDPNAKLLDKSDAFFVSCLVAYSDDGYKKLKEDLTGDDDIDASFAFPEHSYTFPWLSESKKIFVSRFFHKEEVTEKFLTYVDMFNEKISIEKSKLAEREEELAERGAKFVSEKSVKRFKITRYIASGEGILKSSVVPGEHIPVIPQYGERQFVEGEEHYEGIVRLAKDPQRLRNFQMSYLADIVSRSPREKPIFTQEQIQGFEDMYEQSGAENNLPYALQNALDANGDVLPVGPVGYIKAPEIPPALAMSMGESRAAVDDVAGAGLPADITDVDISGKALNSLNKRLDMQSYTYQDNHKFAMRRDGEVYASMMRDIKDVEEDVVLVKVDGSKSKEVINKAKVTFDDNLGVVHGIENNIQEMTFDVYADIGPAFESVKAQNKEEIKELLNSLPHGTPEHTILLNEYLTMTDGMAFKDLRDYGRKQLIMMGVKKPETPEEIQMVEQAQQEQQNKSNPEDTLMKIEMLKQETLMLTQQNKAQELQLNMAKAEADVIGKDKALSSKLAVESAKIDQGQQKIDNDAIDSRFKNPLELAKLELEVGRELNAELKNNQSLMQRIN
jgi:hypothetical protein